MVEGFLIDNTSGTRAVITWAEGAPVRSIWTGLKLDRKAVRDVQTWRCARCGVLESYAA